MSDRFMIWPEEEYESTTEIDPYKWTMTEKLTLLAFVVLLLVFLFKYAPRIPTPELQFGNPTSEGR